MEALALGKTAKDKITKLQGVLVGQATYLSGKKQWLIQPVNAKYEDYAWFDETRVEVVVVVTGGGDASP